MSEGSFVGRIPSGHNEKSLPIHALSLAQKGADFKVPLSAAPTEERDQLINLHEQQGRRKHRNQGGKEGGVEESEAVGAFVSSGRGFLSHCEGKPNRP